MSTQLEIVYSNIDYVASYNMAVDSVARERKYLATTQGFPIDGSKWYVNHVVENNFAQYFVLDSGQVVGWCDITPKSIPESSHIGVLGMGLLSGYRGKGLGKQLIIKTLDHARSVSKLEKVELNVFESNTAAIALYSRLGFRIEGTRQKARKIDGIYDNEIEMGLFL